MSKLLSRMSKFSALNGTTHHFNSPLLPRAPYLLSGYGMDNIRVIEPAKFKLKEELTIEDRKIQKGTSNIVGISHGWHALRDETEDGLITITDQFKPWISSPRFITLPPLEFVPSEICLSSSDPVGNTLVAGMYKSRDILSVCTLDSDKWFHIKEPFPDHRLLGTESMTRPGPDKIMYSKRDETFYFTCKNNFSRIGSVDVTNRKLDSHFLCLGNLHEIHPNAQRALDKCSMTKHLVESPSGELFYIIWYTERLYIPYNPGSGRIKLIFPKPKRFLVFREDEKSKEFRYTEDIGDLSIFLGDPGNTGFMKQRKGEDFCVKASMYPGLKPNSIYYLGTEKDAGFGSYDIASLKVYPFSSYTPDYTRYHEEDSEIDEDYAYAMFRRNNAWISPN